MNLSAQFKKYLLSQADPASKVTVKNYLADLNKFIRWTENKFGKNFEISETNSSLIESFKEDSLKNYSASSVERSLSSLRKFFHFFKMEGQIVHSPFEQITASAEALAKEDPWRLKDFKNHLYVFNASHFTIKNYIIDVKQFLNWAEKVLKDSQSWQLSKEEIFSQINSGLVEEYKERLLKEGRLSPVSVNRKLSSLRKYMSWATKEGLIHQATETSNVQFPTLRQGFAGRVRGLPGQDLAKEGHRGYSSFPPLRLIQKTKNGAVDILDSLFIYPVAALLDRSDQAFWTLKGRPVFKDSLRRQVKIPSLKTLEPKIIPNIPKSFYAPAFISTKNFPLHRKIWHHARNARPNWYKKYHSYAFVSYLHFSILMLFISILGYVAFDYFKPEKQPATLAALPSAPPRILSFQGRLTDSSDNPITQQTSLRMAIYNNATSTGSALLWQEVVSPTPDQDGVFNVLLGENTAIPQSLFAQNSALWLGVAVGQTSELVPRQQIATVAFATNAETLQGLPPITNSTSTTNVVLALNSSGNLSIGGTASPIFQATGGNFTVSGRTLILSTSSNGDVRLAPNGSGGIDVQKALKNTTNNNTLIPGSVEVDDVFAINATSSAAVLNINQGSTGDLIIASTSGTSKFRVDNGGNITVSGTINGLTVSSGTITSGTWHGSAIGGAYGGTGQSSYTGGDMLYASDSTTLTKLGIGGSGTCLTSTGSAPSWASCISVSGGTGFWDQTNGALYPFNSTVDLLVGGQSTASAKFAVLNVNSGTPTASISANSGNNALYISGDGKINTTNKQALVLGNNSSSGNVAVGNEVLGAKFSVGATSTVTSGSDNNLFKNLYTITPSGVSSAIHIVMRNEASYESANNITGGYVSLLDNLFSGQSGSGTIDGVYGNKTQITTEGTINNAYGVQLSLTGGDSGTLVNGYGLWISDIVAASLQYAIYQVGADDTNRFEGLLDVNGAVTLGDGGDSITIDGSSLGLQTTGAGTDITINAVDQIILSDFITDANGVLYADTSGFLKKVVETETGSQCLLSGAGSGGIPSWGSCPASGGGSSNWRIISGALSPINDTLDVLIGSSATSSAKFGFLNVSGGTPTASISGNSGNNTVYLTGTGNLATTNRQTLALGGSTTGNITIDSGAGAISLLDNTSITGTLTASSNLDINGTSNDIAGALNLSGNSLTSSGDLTIAPAGGDTNITGTLDVSGHMALGGLATVFDRSILSIEETLNPTGGVHHHGVRSRVHADAPFDTPDDDTLYAGSFRGYSDLDSAGEQDWIAGVESSFIHEGTTGVVEQALGLFAYISNQNTGTITTGYGIRITGATNTGGGTIGTNYGLFVGAQTAGNSDYGVYIGAADTQTLWVSGSTNSTTAAGGIAFGSSRDTNLYRSAADTLHTDDSFTVGGDADVTGHMALGSSASVDTNSVLNIAETIAAAGSTRRGIFSQITASDTSSDALYGLVARGTSANSSGTNSFAAGMNGQGSMTGAGTVTTLVGNLASVDVNNSTTGTVTNGYALKAAVTATDGTISTGYGLRVDTATNNGGTGVITNNYGIFVQTQTAGVSDFGARIDAADTQTLWISGNADNTTAAAGIAFGLSRDTNLYRSAGNTLKTDDSLVVGTDLSVIGHSGFGSSGSVNSTEVINVTETLNPSGGNTVRGILNTITSDTAFATGSLYGMVSRAQGTHDTGTSDWIAGVASHGTMTGAGTATALIGNYAVATLNNTSTGTVTNAYGLRALINATDGSITTAHGLRIDSADNNGGTGTIGTNYGIFVQPQTAGTLDFGIRVDASDTQTLWVSGDADNTTSAAGIAFGLSRDTTLYRSAADELRTDSELVIQLDGGASTTEALCGNQADGDAADTEGIKISDCSSSPTADYMEMYPLEVGIEPGELVIPSTSLVTTKDGDKVAKLSRSNKKYDLRVIGITSDPDKAGDFNSIGYNINEQDNPKPVALNGRVPVKISQNSESISTGDLLTTSDEPGKATKATQAGQVIGKALEDWTPGTGQSKVMVFVNISWHDPDVYITDAGVLNVIPKLNNDFEVQREGRTIDRIGAFSDLFVARIKAGTFETGKITTETLISASANISELTTNSLAVATENFSIAGQNIRDYIYSLVDQRISENQIAISSPILEADEIKPKSGKEIVIKLKTNDKTSKLEIKNASGSAVASIDAAGNASLSGQLTASDASISGTLRADKIIANQINLSEEALLSLLGLEEESSVPATYITNNYYSTPSASPFAYDPNASSSANTQLSMVNGQYFSTGSATFENLFAKTATFEQGLMSFGPTSFFEASVADRLFVGSQLSIADNTINVLGSNLALQPLRQGGVSFVAGLVEIDRDGNLKVDGNAYFAKDLEVKGNLLANIISPLPDQDLVIKLGNEQLNDSSIIRNSKLEIRNSSEAGILSINNEGDLKASGAGTFNKLNLSVAGEALAVSDIEVIATGSAGTAQIQPNRTELTIRNPLVTEDSLIYVTPKTSLPNQSVYLLRQVPGQSFTVGLSQSISKKMPFNWILIN